MRCCYSDGIAGQAGNDETNVIPNVIPDLIGDLIPARHPRPDQHVIPDLIGDLKPNVPHPSPRNQLALNQFKQTSCRSGEAG